MQPLRLNVMLIAGLAAIGVLLAAVGVWYSMSGDTTTVLAALVEPTTTPLPQATPKLNKTGKEQRK